MDAAEELILRSGYAGTPIEAILERAGITKGTFFYHFKGKADLARAIVERYAANDLALLNDLMGRAEQLSRDRHQQLLIFVGLLIEAMEGVADSYPGCLFASYCYEQDLFDPDTLSIARDAMFAWRERILAQLQAIAAERPPRLEADLTSLADSLMVVIEGAFIVAKTLQEPTVIAQQLRHVRNYLELLFA